MKPKVEAQQVNAFVDAELDLGARLDMEERMQVDASLRGQVQGLRQLRTTIHEGARYHTAPADFRSRMASLVEPKSKSKPEPQPRIRTSHVAAVLRGWFAWRPMAASFMLLGVMAVALNLGWLSTARDDRMLDDVVASHVRSTLGQHLVDVASSDHHTVKPWLASKLDFSPPVNELHLPDCVFLGGRVDYLDGRPVAALVYRKGEHIVSDFVWPTTSKDSKADFLVERGFQAARWSQGDMTHWVVSDVNKEEFKAVVRAIQVADSDR
jgi:anti-sigma factor RsiW